MKSLSNIEKHPLYKGRYIGYCANGWAFRVQKIDGKYWRALNVHYGKVSAPLTVDADTLTELSNKLSQIVLTEL